jgi:hypothetical protein
MEFSLSQISVSAELKNPENLVCKGISEKFNYMITNTYFYDFQY